MEKPAFEALVRAGYLRRTGPKRYEMTERGVEWMRTPASNGFRDQIEVALRDGKAKAHIY